MFSSGSTYDADELNIATVLPAVFNVLIVKDEEVDMFKMEEVMKNARCCLDILIHILSIVNLLIYLIIFTVGPVKAIT